MTDHSATPAQTVGPFFHYALPYPDDHLLVPNGTQDSIQLRGNVYDGEGQPVPDALIELWQPDAAGRIVHRAGSLRRDGWTFTGWGRSATDATGCYSFTTVAPGAIAPHSPAYFGLTVFARGLLNRLSTRAYLPMPDITFDAMLADLDPERRRTLLCSPDPTGYRFDIHLQGERETTFLDYASARP